MLSPIGHGVCIGIRFDLRLIGSRSARRGGRESAQNLKLALKANEQK